MKKHRLKLTGLAAAILVLFAGLTAGNAYIAGTTTAAPAASPASPVAQTPEAIPAEPTAPPADPAPETETTGATTLVVYFSYEGSTEQLAEFVHDRVGGDLYEIVPETPYSENFDETADFALEEQRNGVFPEIAGDAIDTTQYDTIFLGHPNWWGEQPMVVQTFMRDNDLNGTTIVPFVSHDGSRFGNSLEVLERSYPDSTILEGFAVRGDDVRSNPEQAQADIIGWLEGLGY